MLYVTTANKFDTFTGHYTLCREKDELFVPYQMPKLTPQEIDSLKGKSFGQRVADILNRFFSAHLSGWDVDFCIGRKPVKLVSMSNRILIAETWHNLDWDFAGMVRNLSDLLLADGYAGCVPGRWAWIAVRIAVLFGIFGELENADSKSKIDIAVVAGDFSVPFSAWYAREMGLPIGTIIVSCSEGSGVWELLRNGQIRTDSVFFPRELERMIFVAAGFEAAQDFRNAYRTGKSYIPRRDVVDKLRRGMAPAVISGKRSDSAIRNLFRDNNYIMDKDTAWAYCGLQDHLALAKESSTAFVLSEKSPACSLDTVADALGISVQALRKRLDIT